MNRIIKAAKSDIDQWQKTVFELNRQLQQWEDLHGEKTRKKVAAHLGIRIIPDPARIVNSLVQQELALLKSDLLQGNKLNTSRLTTLRREHKSFLDAQRAYNAAVLCEQRKMLKRLKETHTDSELMSLGITTRDAIRAVVYTSENGVDKLDLSYILGVKYEKLTSAINGMMGAWAKDSFTYCANKVKPYQAVFLKPIGKNYKFQATKKLKASGEEYFEQLSNKTTPSSEDEVTSMVAFSSIKLR